MKSSCDIGGSKYPWPTVYREMKSSRVGLSLGCHRMIELGDDPRIIVLTRNHEWLQMVSLYDDHGVSGPQQMLGDHSTPPHENLSPCS